MKFKHGILLVFSLCFLSFGLPKNIQKKVDKTIKTTFEVDEFSLESFTISEDISKELPSKFEADNFFKILSEQNKIGYAYLAKAPSKTAEFDYLVILDNDLIVKKTKVLIYREEYGGEIGSKRWLKQFIGKTKTDDLRHGDNIINISGATISVRSMTSAMNNLLLSLKTLSEKGIL